MTHTAAPDSASCQRAREPDNPSANHGHVNFIHCAGTPRPAWSLRDHNLRYDTKLMSAQKIPLLDLKAQFAPLRGGVLEAIARVCDTQHFILGPEVEGLERELAAFLEVPHAIGVSSGTDALLAALMALDVGPGDEVVTTPFSFFATAGSIARLGARPVFVDIDRATFNIDAGAVASAMTPRTKAIMPVSPVRPERRHGADSRGCGARGRACRGRCRTGDRRVLSRQAGRRHRRHRLLLVFSDEESRRVRRRRPRHDIRAATLARKLRAIRQHGGEVKYHHDLVGANFRIDALQAAILRVKLPHLEAGPPPGGGMPSGTRRCSGKAISKAP